MAPKTQKEKEQEAAEGPAGVGGGILSMMASIGGMIPSLRKGPQTDYLKRVQKGGGTGAALARQTASEAARRVVGASAAQPSSGRGGNLREGLRAADDIVQRGAQQAAVTGAREAFAATQQLRSNEFKRRGQSQLLGAGIGAGLSGIAGTLAAAKDQGPTAGAPAAPGGGGSLVRAIDASIPPDAPGPGSVFGTSGGRAPGEAPSLDVNTTPLLEPQFMPDGSQQPTGAAPTSPEDVKQGVMGAASPQAQEDRALLGLAEETAKRQRAELGYMSTASTPEAEAFRAARKKQEEWLYYQAMNYDPMAVGSQMGIDPLAAEEMLRDIGLEPDMARLGIEGGDGQRK